MTEPVEIRPYSNAWALAFEAEEQKLRNAFPDPVVRIEHIGSTSVPGLCAKPIIDILVGLPDWSWAEMVASKLATQGYRQGEAPSPDGRRMFFMRNDGSGSPTNLHIAPIGSDPWKHLLAFRDCLRGDASLANAYGALKIALAQELDDATYTAAKSPFVQSAINRIPVREQADSFLCHQRAELSAADAFRGRVLLLQLLLSIIAATSIFAGERTTQLTLAILAGITVVIWLVLTRVLHRHRAAGDRARRIVLLASGLGACPADAGVMIETFSAEVKCQYSVDTYFDTRAPPGFRRIAEMIDESAFYTGHLQRRSGELMSFVVLAVVLAAIVLWVASARQMNIDMMVLVARVFLAFVIFLLSSDVLGAAFGHFEAARTMTEIRLRLNAAKARNCPQADMISILTDYNSALESSPMALPGLYACERERMDKQWRAYLAVEARRIE